MNLLQYKVELVFGISMIGSHKVPKLQLAQSLLCTGGDVTCRCIRGIHLTIKHKIEQY